MALTNYTSCGSVTLAGIDARCDKSFGGIKRILVAKKDDIVSTTIDAYLDTAGTTLPNDTELITNITRVSGKVFYEFLFRRNTGSYTTTVAPDVAIGNSFATTEVTLQFSKSEAQKRMIIQSLINAGAVMIIEDMYGQFIYLGMDREVVITNATMASGKVESDLNGFTLTLSDVALDIPHFINTTNGDKKVDIEALKVTSSPTP